MRLQGILFIVVALLVPTAAWAQDPAMPRVVADHAVGESAPANSEAEDVVSQQAPGPTTQPAKNPRSEIKRPKAEGSMVGYVDDAIIGSQVRLRFDAGFGVNAPDRDEFFYSKCGCYAFLPHNNPAYDPHASGLGAGGANNLNFQQIYLQAEYAPFERLSLFSEVPFRFIQPQSFITTLLGNPIPVGFQRGGVPGAPALANPSGVSDVRFGFKFALLSSERSVFTFQFRDYAPTGNVLLGLGNGHWSVEPSLLYYRQLSDRWTIEGQLGDWHPIGGSAGIPTNGSSSFAGDVFLYGVGPSYQVYRSRNFQLAPVFELFGWHVISGFQTGPANPDASGVNIVNLKFGARLNIQQHNSVYVGYGRAVTSADWYRNLLRVEYRYAF
jgi:hypothetical protein